MKAVFFDLDDTLYPEMMYVRSGYRAVTEELDLQGTIPLSREEIYESLLALFDESPKNVFNRFFDKVDVRYTKEDIEELVHVYRHHTPRISFYHDVPHTISGLKQRDFLVGVLTDGYAVTQKKKVEALKCGQIFDCIILTDELGKDCWKPSDKGFRKGAKELGIAPEDIILYVGDNPEKDFEIVRSLPRIKTVRILREGGIYLKAHYASAVREHYTVSNLSEIVPIAEKVGRKK
ncbi:MAG: HAD hydrolase-like protein [Lachnospiraceae bacterium]|nr:HAD hydrolase-like protein [Lachnospiraceae bacterium]